MHHPTDRIAHTTAFVTPIVLRSQRFKERNILFNEALNTFYLRLYGVGHTLKDQYAKEETRCCH